MPTIITHAVVPLALGSGAGRRIISAPLLVAGGVAAMVPDLDVLAFRFGISYSNQLGHRGFSHSLLFAVVTGIVALLFARPLRTSRLVAFLFVFGAIASHGLLDALTNGGLGVALVWPFSERRFFAPWQVIRVSPFSLHQLLGQRGLQVVLSELKWVWVPSITAGCLLAVVRRGFRWR